MTDNEKSSLRKWLEEANRYYTELGGWKTFRSGEWLWVIIDKSFKNYWERANAEYFYKKYPDLDVDQIAKKLIAVAAKNATILGGTTAATVSTDEIVGLLTGFEGGVGLPANIAIGVASISAEAILLVRILLQLVANLGKLYGAPLDPDEPEDTLTILAFAVGGAAADAAGKAGMKIGGKAAELGVKQVFRKEFLAALKKIAARVGVKILQRSIVKYTVPVVSIGIGSSWNYFATKNVGRIAIRHFRQRAAEQVTKIADSVRAYAGQQFWVPTSSENKECLAVANRVFQALHGADWEHIKPEYIRPDNATFSMLGGISRVLVHVNPKAADKTQNAANTLVSALNNAKIVAEPRQQNDPTPNNKIELDVGTKP